jgi:predicted phosphohydrolase
MRLLFTADLHYNVPRSREGAEAVAREACALGGDAIVLLGDSAGADLDAFGAALRLFADFPGRRLLVPGNHELWTRDGESSLHRYQRLVPDAARREGFEVLDFAPQVLGEVGIVGSVGWYDYSLADETLGIPREFYAAKVSPAAAEYLDEPHHRALLARHGDRLGERQRSFRARWMDGVRVRLGMSDAAFVERLRGRLRSQLAGVAPRVRRIVACFHHLPFAEQLPPNRPPKFAFAGAFLGSGAFGAECLREPKVTHAISGHSHWPDARTIGRVRAINVGCTYREKRLEVLDLPEPADPVGVGGASRPREEP